MTTPRKRNLSLDFDGARRIAFLAIGSDLRADDSAGILVGRSLERHILKKKTRIPAKVFFGFTAPENITGEIKKFRPTHLVIIDSADMGKRPGEAELLEAEAEGKSISFTTHQLPVKVLVAYLLAFLKCKVAIIGIQPKTTKFGLTVSREVMLSVKRISADLLQELP